jgi:Rrf2 family nitric oxide-sensitive transcriptional repressor
VQISAYSDYSLRVLMHAALCSPARITIDEVALAFGISRHHLVKIVHDLGRSGYLETYRGIGGGFTLARPADEIGVGDVVRLGEESERVIECKRMREGPCRIRSVCRLKGVLDEAAAAFFAVLDRYSLADLVAKPSPLRQVLGI